MKLVIDGLPRVLPLVAVAVAVAAPKLAYCASVTERYEYHDNPAIWVMGQVSKVTCVSSTEGGCSNTVVAEAAYDPAKATQLTFKSFGKLQQTLTYYGDGSVKTVKDGNNNVTTLGDWYRGVPRSVTFADTKTQKAVVNDQGWIRAITDENNYRTCYDFDAMGRLKKTTYPSESTADTCDATTWNESIITYAQVATAEYGIPAGHWRQTVQTGNGYKFTYFDGQWRPLVVREYDSGNVPGTQRFQRFAYDHEGRVTFEAYPGTSDGLTSGKRTIYDPLGRVTRLEADSELGVLATTTEYLTGFQTRVTDPRNYKTTTSFVVYDKPKEEVLASIVHPEGAFTDFTRDAYGKALSIVRRDSGSTLSATRTYQYNAYQELCKVVEPETGATLTGYDGAGNVKWSAAGLPSNQACEAAGTTAAVAARRVDRKYDSRNRLWTLEFPDGNGNQTWTYTDDGKPKTVTTANPSLANPSLITFTYFRRGLAKSEANVISSTTYTTSWTYNANGHLLSQTYPSTLNVAYAPNALGQPTQAGSFATAVSYYPNGAIKAFTYGNGVLHSMTQNARQLPSRSTDCKVSGTCAVADMRLDLSYVYDKAGNITSITDGENGRQTRGMTYDGLQRLKTVSSTMFGAATYGYNQLDDLRQVTIAAGSQVRDHRYCYNATTRRLMTVRAPGSGDDCTGTIVQSLAYDVQGNIKTLGSQALVFDFGNRLREATGKENYAYDGFGHRVSSCETTGDCAHWVYSSKGRLEYSHDARNNKRVDHIYLGTSLVAQRERTLSGSTATNRYQHTDMLGSPISVTGADKAYLNKYEYEPYGLQVNGTLQDGPGYTGHVQDAATKLTYMQQRYYEPSIGRFLSIDPVTADPKTGGNFNRYAYANNNPYKFADPDGRVPILVPIAIFIAKELASEAVEQATGVPMPTLKNAGKAVGKRVLKEGSKDATEAAAKKVPNPFGKKGGLAHQEKVAEVAEDVKNRGLTPVKEYKVDTPDGSKGSRYVDVAGVDPKTGKAVEFNQVGKSNADGGAVSRERKAMADITEAKPEVPVKYHPYDR